MILAPGPIRSSVDHEPAARRGARGSLVAMGLAGGLVPSPSAVVVLLGASAAGVAWFGVLLVLAFGIGMAVTLAAVGLLARAAADRITRLAAAGRSHVFARVSRVLPQVSAVAVLALGVYLTVSALRSAR